MGRDTYYDILGVSSTAEPDEIKMKYRKLIQRIHPDLDGPVALFRQVQEAYEVLSDPARRVAYDRSLHARWGAAPARSGDLKGRSPRETAWYPPPRGSHSGPGPVRSGGTRPSDRSPLHTSGRSAPRQSIVPPVLRRHPAGALAIGGATLVFFSAALGHLGDDLIPLGCVVLIIAGIAGLGGRGAKEREAFHRSGMAAVDAMTGRQFEVLLEYLFANKGYRVARIGGRAEFGATLLINDANGRTVVQAKRRKDVVRHDAVHKAVGAMAHYGVARALVVTSSDYSRQAVTVAHSNGVALWNRATLAAELSALCGEPLESGVRLLSSELRAGSRICLGFFATLIVALVATSSRAHGRYPTTRRRG